MKRVTVLGVFALILAIALPAWAITRGGEADAGEHPYVGLMVAYEEPFDHDDDPESPDIYRPIWRCSGALISPTVFVTAGHCTGLDPFSENEPVKAAIWFDDTEGPIRAGGFPFYELASHKGTPTPHPDYVPRAFFLFDAGVVVLDAPADPSGSGHYASLPNQGALDDIGKGRKQATLEAVGYGLQKINPVMIQEDLDKLKATLFLVNAQGVAGLGSFNPGQSIVVSGDAKHGGTCFGDSGGPMLIGDSDVIGAVTSFGLNGNCAGIGGGYRIDQPDDLAWLSTFLP